MDATGAVRVENKLPDHIMGMLTNEELVNRIKDELRVKNYETVLDCYFELADRNNDWVDEVCEFITPPGTNAVKGLAERLIQHCMFAADQGSPSATYAAVYCCTCFPEKVDQSKVYDLLVKVAGENHSLAQELFENFRFGDDYLENLSLDKLHELGQKAETYKDCKNALIVYLTKANRPGCGDSLEPIYSLIKRSTPEEQTQLFKICKPDDGHISSHMISSSELRVIAHCYENGYGVEMNSTKASKLNSKADELERNPITHHA